MRQLYCFVIAILLSPAAVHADDFALKDGDKVVFLGDSNTFAGQYIAYIDLYLSTRFPNQKFELINVGLPSETVSGLSEPDHPFPRPDLHTRLDKVLAKTKPDVVIASYGMNDGIYYPYSKERFARHREGIEKLIDKVKKANAKLILVTTSPFDPLPVRKKLLQANAPKYSWMRPYENYDDVLRKFSDWLLTLRKQGFIVVDTHAAVNRHLQTMRQKDPNYHLAGDGIHPNATGHWIVAAEILKGMNAPAEVADIALELIDGNLTSRKGKQSVSAMKAENGTLQFDIKAPLPMPRDSRWPKTFPEFSQIQSELNVYRLQVSGLSTEHRYELLEGTQRLGQFTGKELAEGMDLTQLAQLSTNVRAAKVQKLVERRSQLLGRAWLDAIGHNRPNTPKGLPLEQAQKQAGALTEQIAELSAPETIHLQLSPIK